MAQKALLYAPLVVLLIAGCFSETYDLGSDWMMKRISRRSIDSGVNWALDRLDERARSMDGKVDHVAVGDVYVVGGGVHATHSEFGDRVLEGYSWDGSDSREDCSDGVSTGAASIAIGSHMGIARSAHVFPVKVGCQGSVSSSALSRGLQWVKDKISSLSGHRAVILLTVPVTTSVSVLNSLAADHLVVIPAGDQASDQCSSLESLDEIGIMIVAGSTPTDTQSSSSNYGKCIDIWAPGDEVRMASASDDTSTRTGSSTVYAAAAVAGTAVSSLIHMREVGDVVVLKALLLARATKGALTLSESAKKANTKNRLLFDICPYYKRPEHGKCYVAQTKQLVNVEKNNVKMDQAAKSVVTFDDMAYNYYEDCLTALLFASSETSTRVEATHRRDGNDIKHAVFTITTKDHKITLSSGPRVLVDDLDMDLSSPYYSDDVTITNTDYEVRTQSDEHRFVPLVTVSLPNNVSVSFDGHQQIRIELVDIQLFQEKTEGICGFLDNSHVKEFVDRQGNDMEFTFKENKEKYVKEWSDSLSDCDNPPPPLCDDDSKCQEAAEVVCYPLKDPTGVFNQCFEIKDPSSWYTNCVDAVRECCCSEQDTKKCACEEQLKYWWAAMLEGCTAIYPCENPCKKPETDPECVDDARNEIDFFYKETISYDPKDECHYVDKHDDIECKHDGSWNLEPSDCKIKTCTTPDLTDLIEYKSDPIVAYICGDEVQYKCTKTECDCNCYEMKGDSKTECVSNGERTAGWSNTPPTCSLKHCPTPLPPNVDRRISADLLSWVVDKDNLDRSCCAGRAKFACHECYDLHGAEELSCCNNKWGDGTLPECRLKECVDPSIEVKDGGDAHLVVKGPDGHYCSYVINYSCDSPCYEIEGSATRTCETNGEWSGSMPRCVKKKCPAIRAYDDGEYLFNGGVIAEGEILECGDAIHVKCNDCHWPCASTCDRTCKWNGTEVVWSNSEPQCAPYQCRQRSVPNASVSNKKGPLECGERSEAHCNTCYEQRGGDNVRGCTAPSTNETCPVRDVDGLYDGEEIECVKMSCDELELGPNIRIKEKTCSNDMECYCVVTFECDSDCYEMSGASTINCNGFGWDNAVPTCNRKTCPFIKPSYSRMFNYEYAWKGGCQFMRDGERVTPDDVLYCGDVLDVEAEYVNCYHVCNKKQMECTTDGTWVEEGWVIANWNISNCMYMECEAPPTVDHARLLNDDKEYNCTTTLRYECEECYKHVSGDLERDCVAKDITKSPDGVWSGQSPVCEKMACVDDDYPVVANATVAKKDLSCGGKLTYTCDDCSKLVGNNEILCTQPDLSVMLTSWVNTPPTCQPICCPPLPSVRSGEVDYDVVSTGGRFLRGPHPLHEKCGDNYVCQEVAARCDECYEYRDRPDGTGDHAPTRMCAKDGSTGNGYWTNADKVCTRKECPAEKIPTKKRLHYTTSDATKKCNQTIGVECDCCYKLTDTVVTATLQCLPSKLWDKELPTCVPVACTTPADIENGEWEYIQSESACTCGTVRYECDQCFRLVGEEMRTCDQDPNRGTAQWSSEPPVCEPICCEHLEDPIDPILKEKSTELHYKKSPRPVKLSFDQISVKDNYETCEQDYVCQIIDPECGVCFEYTGEDGNTVDGVNKPPAKQCVKKEVNGQLIGEWTNRNKNCTLKECLYRKFEEEKHLRYTFPESYNENTPNYCLSNVTVTCEQCYEISEQSRSESHTCLSNKTWSHDVPTCKRTECPTPPGIDHCSYKAGDNLCSFKRELECDECYYEDSCSDKSLTGVMEVQCNYDKSWSWVTKTPEMNLRQCPEATEIDNGQVDTTGRGCGDMARYSCDRCHRFSHASDCLCERRKCIPDPSDCTKGMWNETAPVCEKITCQTLPAPPTNGRNVSVDDTCDGSAVYECDEGYYLTDGDLVRNCTEWGTWTGKHPICSIKRCTTMSDSPHRTHFPMKANTYGTIVKFECEDCFKFADVFYDESVKDTESIYPRFHILLCEATGNWNGSAPVCQQKRCPNPDMLANGRLTSGANFECGDTITYECHLGYRFKAGSSSKRVCEGDTWTGEAPVCLPVDCGDVDVDPPLVADYINTTYGYEVSYSCGKNYKQSRCYYELAPQETICQANGTWETAPSECVRMQCQQLAEVAHGTLKKTRVKLGDTDCAQQFQVKCEEGYKLQGSPYLWCSGTSWAPSPPPTCVKRMCVPQQQPQAGSVDPSWAEQDATKMYYGDRLNYACDECYVLEGAEVRECVTDPGSSRVTWSTLEPTCLQIKCPLLGIKNGWIRNYYDAADLPGCGETVQFECDHGYKLFGTAQATCTSNKTFDTVLPTCEEITCRYPGYRGDHMGNNTYPPVQNSTSLTQYRPYTEIDYECADGWELVGEEIIQCRGDGTWDDVAPSCEPHLCEELGEIANGKVVVDSDVMRTITCDSCYQPANPGAVLLTCGNGQWNPPIPSQCEVVKCGNPDRAVGNGQLTEQMEDYVCGRSVTFVCDDGFAMSGTATLTCRNDGTWDNTFPLCVEKSCPGLETDPNAKTTVTYNGSQVHYECKEGYELYGDAVRICLNGSQWSGPGPTSCKVAHCGNVGGILYGTVKLIQSGLQGEADTPGAKVQYTCKDDRYQLDGSDERVCMNNKQWTFAPPQCVCVSCPILSLNNGRIETVDENKVGTSVQYICDLGYKLVPEGLNTRTCVATGEWDGIGSQCERIKCTKKIPENGRIAGAVKSEYDYLETVQIVCEPWKNKLVYKCGDNGEWEGDVDKDCDTCKEVRREVVTTVTKVIPGICILGVCTKETTVQFPVTSYVTEVVCQ